MPPPKLSKVKSASNLFVGFLERNERVELLDSELGPDDVIAEA